MSNPVSRTTLHSRYNKQERATRTLEQDIPVEIPCRVMKVYDPELEAQEDFPEYVQERIAEDPGRLWCLVELVGAVSLVLPFQESADHIYAVYGNCVALEGVQGKIRYSNYSIQTGVVILTKQVNERVVDLGSASFAADIGGIIGMR